MFDYSLNLRKTLFFVRDSSTRLTLRLVALLVSGLLMELIGHVSINMLMVRAVLLASVKMVLLVASLLGEVRLLMLLAVMLVVVARPVLLLLVPIILLVALGRMVIFVVLLATAGHLLALRGRQVVARLGRGLDRRPPPGRRLGDVDSRRLVGHRPRRNDRHDNECTPPHGWRAPRLMQDRCNATFL